jgi:hypothetical protein
MPRVVLVLLAVLTAAAPAGAIVRLPTEAQQVKGNPAERLRDVPIEDAYYEGAERCTPKAKRPGVDAFVTWLGKNAEGVFWGSYRCEKWGRRQASLHAEKRAVDWHLDASLSRDRKEAARLLRLLTAPDSYGNQQALARRMGLEEIIWDCGYWSAGMTQFREYSPCLDRHGRLKRRVNATLAHRDHIHFGFTKAGAAGRTSFWQQGR